MARNFALALSLAGMLGALGCAQCDTCDDFPAPYNGPHVPHPGGPGMVLPPGALPPPSASAPTSTPAEDAPADTKSDTGSMPDPATDAVAPPGT